MLKNDIIWPKHRQFSSNKEWEPIYFFSECLSNSQKFDLSLGFFSSTAIRTLSCSFASFIYNGGKMRLIINNILSEDDKQTIIRGTNGEVINSFDFSDIKKLQESLSSYDKHFFDCLVWLIASNRIEIMAIEPLGGKGIAHTKSGLFYDNHNLVGFNGSCNFTKTALLDNIESIDAYCEWDGDIMVAKIQNLQDEFNDRFSKLDTSVKYVDPKDIVNSIQQYFKTKNIDELLSQERKLIEKELNSLKKDNIHLRPAIIDTLERAENRVKILIKNSERERSMPKFPFLGGAREYQKIAFNNWKDNNQKGLFAMATGTGKTITSLNCLLEIYKKGGYYKAIILVPTITLLKQWEKECRKFNFNNITKVYSKNNRWRADVDNLLLQERINGKNDTTSYIIISTYASFAKENVFNTINQFSKSRLLLIADEAHNMGSGQVRNKLSAIRYGRRIGLSATPERQYDEAGNKELMAFFGSEDNYTYEYSMKEAIDNGILCKYYYYPHLVKLTEDEMSRYVELSIKIAKFASSNGELFASDSILTRLLLARKRIIHKAENKKIVFQKILRDRIQDVGNLKYTLIYVPEGNQPDEEADIFVDRENLSDDIDSLHLIDQYTAIVKNIHPKVTVKQFTSSSMEKDNILDDFAEGRLDVLTSMKCLDEGVDVPRSEMAIFCASTGNPRQFIQRRGRILRTHKDKHIALIHDLVVVPEINSESESYQLERNMIRIELSRVRNFALLSENSSNSISELDEIFKHYNLSIF